MDVSFDLFLHISGMLVGLICVIGNALVCHIIVRLKSMKTSMNYIILNLAILDAMTGFFGIFFVIANDNRGVLGPPVLQLAYNQSKTLADHLCKLRCAYWFGGAVSPLLLTVMAFERYKAIIHPLSSLGGGTKARLKWILLLSWISGFGVYIIDMIIAQYNIKYVICDYKDYPWFNRKIYFIVFAIGMYIIPCIAMITFYSRAILALRRHDQVLSSQIEGRRVRNNARKRVLKAAIFVTCMFYILCGLPYTLNGLDELLGIFSASSKDLFFEAATLSTTLNSAINPFVYFFFIKSFRDGFHRVFICPRERMCSAFTAISLSRRSNSFERTDTITESSVNQPALVAVKANEETLEFNVGFHCNNGYRCDGLRKISTSSS